MENKKQNGISKASIVFYVMAVIFVLIAAFSIYQAYLTVQGYKAQYTLQFADVLNIYLQGCSPSFAFAFIFYGIGVILNKINDMNSSLSLCMDDAVGSKTYVDTIYGEEEADEDFIAGLKSTVEEQEAEKSVEHEADNVDAVEQEVTEDK